MFKYKWTPFQLLALVAFSFAIYDIISIAKMEGDPGLGGFSPIVYGACGVGLLIMDMVFQILLRKYQKAFFISEVILVLALALWIYSLYD